MTADAWRESLTKEPPILVTGAAGFIGYHLSERLLQAGLAVDGLDNLSPYYDTTLKEGRLARLAKYDRFRFTRCDVSDAAAVDSAVAASSARRIVHLAAQAGVRHSIENPHSYGDANLTGFLNVLEACRRHGVRHLVYASSSSVYGGNRKLPYTTRDNVDHPVSLYAATKKANELMAHAYSHLYGLAATGLRFFTVYGPWGRPDMAYWIFSEAIARGRPLQVFNHGRMKRDFTYVDDIVDAMARLIPKAPEADPAFDFDDPHPGASWAPHRVYNIGATRPENIMDMIAILEDAIGAKARIDFQPMQPGDVPETWADVDDLEAAVGFRPQIDLRTGLRRFVAWHKEWLARPGSDA